MMTKYRTLYDDMLEKIRLNEWYENMLLPSEAELCASYKVSRITVRRALEELEHAGFVQRMQGRGTIVKSHRLHSGQGEKGLLQTMAEQGFVVETKLLRKETLPVTDDLANKLAIPHSGKVWHFRRVRSVLGHTIALMDSFVPFEIGNKMCFYDLEHISFYKLYGIISRKSVESTQASVTAINPSPEICDLLGEPHGTAHIWYKSIAYLEDGKPIEVADSIFNARYYEFAVSSSGQRFMAPTTL